MDAYEIKERIGQGQFSQVYSAIHKATQTQVALKLVQKPLKDAKESSDFISMDTLKEEVKCQRGLRHENILRLLACFETEKEIVFVTELCKGDLLKVLRKNGKFSENETRKVAQQLVSALKYIHERNIIHRDLKLQNILIGMDGKFKICDFGFSKRTQSQIVLTSVKGTPIYMAPELIREQPYTHLVDIWALGVILFELYTGLPPFYTTNIFNLVNLILNQSIKWPFKISPEFKNLLQKLLEKDTSKRIDWPELQNDPFICSEKPKSLEQKRADSAVDMPQAELKTQPTIKPSLKILLEKSKVDWNAVQEALKPSDQLPIFTDSNLVSVFTTKLILSDKTAVFADYLEILTRNHSEACQIGYISRSLKQLLQWSLGFIKGPIVDDKLQPESHFRIMQSFKLIIQNFQSLDFTKWVPSLYSQYLLSIVPIILNREATPTSLNRLVSLITSLFELYQFLPNVLLLQYSRDIADLDILNQLLDNTLVKIANIKLDLMPFINALFGLVKIENNVIQNYFLLEYLTLASDKYITILKQQDGIEAIVKLVLCDNSKADKELISLLLTRASNENLTVSDKSLVIRALAEVGLVATGELRDWVYEKYFILVHVNSTTANPVLQSKITAFTSEEPEINDYSLFEPIKYVCWTIKKTKFPMESPIFRELTSDSICVEKISELSSFDATLVSILQMQKHYSLLMACPVDYFKHFDPCQIIQYLTSKPLSDTIDILNGHEHFLKKFCKLDLNRTVDELVKALVIYYWFSAKFCNLATGNQPFVWIIDSLKCTVDPILKALIFGYLDRISSHLDKQMLKAAVQEMDFKEIQERTGINLSQRLVKLHL